MRIKSTILFFLCLLALKASSQWQYVNPTFLSNGAGSYILQTSVVGRTGGNNFYANTWLYGTHSVTTWDYTKHVTGISIDASFQTPFTSRSWWSRDAYNNIQSWGDMGNTYLTINAGNVGIGTTTPTSRLTISGSEAGIPSVLVSNTSYGSTHSSGTVSMQFGFSNHVGPKIEAAKQTFNTTGINFYTEYGFNTMQHAMAIVPSGSGSNVGIGTTTPDSKLTVKGDIHTREVKVDLAGAVGPDYVFEKDYPLTSLEDLKSYIDENKHLPEIPSAKEMEEKGINLKEMNLLLLKKVEELTLHLIKKDEEISILQHRIELIENSRK